MKFKYKINVLPEEGGEKSRNYIVESDHEIKEDFLQCVGLILDGGCTIDDLEQMIETAKSYVNIT